MNKAIIFDIQRGSFVDGPGIRTTVFFKGCNLRCKWCHNPESQEKYNQILFYKEKCTGCGKCKTVCPNALEKCDACGKCALYCPNDARELCGKNYTASEVLAEILKDKDYYGTRGGATFSGGECMLQIDFLEEILALCKANGVGTAVDTAGCVPFEYFTRIMPYTDLFLYDVKCFTSDLHKEGTGASNALILDNLARLKKEFKGEIIARIPVISGFNANIGELTKVAKFLKELGVEKVDLLPYHAMGEHKWKALGLEPAKYIVPSVEEMEEYKKLFN